MRLLFWIAPLVGLLAAPGFAQQMLVTTGEHNGFTRLVSQVPEGSEWVVEKQGRSVEIVFTNHSRGFDVDGVFQRITTDRISDITDQPDRLALQLGCDCDVAAFQVNASFIAIDVGDPGTPLASALVKESIPEVAEVTDAIEAPITPPAAQPDPMQIELPLVAERTPSFELPQLTVPSLNEPQQIATAEPRTTALLAQMRQQLARDLGEAATRGVLTPSTRAQPDEDVTTNQSVPPASPAPRPLPVLAAPDPTQNIRITSSNDTIESRTKSAQSPRNPKPSCNLADRLNVSEWNDGNGFEVQIGNGRAALFGEFDKLETKSIVSLAQSYLYFGFGIEAIKVLEMDPKTLQKHPHLLELAQIIDQEPPVQGSTLTPLVECNNAAALWAQLAGPEIAGNAVLNTAAALQALNDLPSHLRQILAPALANRLRAFGNHEDAAAALRSIKRLPTPAGPDAQMAQAEQDIEAGDHEEGTEALAEIASQNVSQAPEALIRLIDTQASTGQPISESDIQLLDAYAKEFEDTDLGHRLVKAHLRGLIETDQFMQAQERIAGLDPSAAETAAVQTDLFKAIIERADDVVFLEHAFANSPSATSPLDMQTSIALAQRYLDLGFAKQTQTTLEQIQPNTGDDGINLLSAKAALALSEPFQAQAHLLNVTGAEADLLRAQALSQIGQHAQAAEFYRQADATREASSAAWLAENWQEITDPETEVFGPIAEVSNTQPALSLDAARLLTTSAEAIEESDAARKTIQALLDETQLQIPEIVAE